jgi:hypothetical protein
MRGKNRVKNFFNKRGKTTQISAGSEFQQTFTEKGFLPQNDYSQHFEDILPIVWKRGIFYLRIWE